MAAAALLRCGGSGGAQHAVVAAAQRAAAAAPPAGRLRHAHSAAALNQDLQAELQSVLGDRLSTARAALEAHGRDESFHPAVPPQAVVYPESTEEVAAVVRACAARRVPVVPFGVGTSLEGHVAALHGGVCVDTSRMNRVLEVSAEDMDCRVQAGVTRLQLARELHGTGVFFPVDPGADATIGGMASTRASGTAAVRYGTMRDAVRGLTVVLPSGEVMHTGRRVRKTSAGYDLTGLWVGSEGTLGVITEVSLRLHPLPAAVSAASCAFPDLRSAAEAVTTLCALGVPLARCELLDALSVHAVNRYSNLQLREAPSLFLEFEGPDADAVRSAAAAAGDACRGCGGSDFAWAELPEERAALWKARHSAYYAMLALRPGAKGLTTDVCVPPSRLTECIVAAQALCVRHGITAPLLGHVGDGNFHMILLVDPDNPQELETAAVCVDQMVALAQRMGGTCTGEHGIGHGKLHHLQAEHGMPALQVMHAIKQAIDPLGIMNPGKLGGDPACFAAR